MATYEAMQIQIIDELGDRSDLLASMFSSMSSPIKSAISSAITKWQREPFYFNEVYSQPFFTTVSGREFYTSADDADIANTPYVWNLHALISANRWPLTKRTWQDIEGMSENPAARGQPTEWAYLGQTIRLYPIPNGAYPIRASRLLTINNEFVLDESLLDGPDVLAPAGAFLQAWLDAGYDLIKCEAKLILANDLLHDDDLARRMKIAIYGDPSLPGDRGYLHVLKAETMRRAATGRVRATQF